MTLGDGSRDPAEVALGVLRALEKLPPFTGIVFRGLPTIPEINRARWTNGLTATSLDPRVGTENFTTPVIAAILSRTGRELTAFAEQPNEQEVLLPPNVMLHTLMVDTAPDGRTPLIVIEQLAELDPNVSLPPTLAELVAQIDAQLADAIKSPAVEVTSPGKFTESLYFLS
ncbi:MAG: hypothetical protein ABI137_08220 [Antricoccus sp.]